MRNHSSQKFESSRRGRTGRVAALFGLLLCLGTTSATRADDREQFFETQIRPLLAEHCVRCHGPDEQSGELRLDALEHMLEGGDQGPAIIANKPDESLMIKAVRRSGDLEMPPDEPLSEQQIAALRTWIADGAYWPAARPQISIVDAANDHWAFQPVEDVSPPDIPASAWDRTPVDTFVRARLMESELTPSPEADRRTLIRRLYYTLTGLPPSAEDVREFERSTDPRAYEQVVERLLDSPQYGEHWARHWLDVARYSDTKGYVYAREERFWVHAWTYRDWVVSALNDDLPYDRFLLLQLAADQVEDRGPDDLAAMGFLTLGRRFLGVEREIIDDRIDVVCRGTMGLTVTCARCHDHKYDPIPTADYYSLYGVFDSCREEMVRLSPPSDDAAFEAELEKRQQALADGLAEAREVWSKRIRERVGDYLQAQTELDKYPAQGFDQILQVDDVLPEFVRRWQTYLANAERRGDPVFIPWHLFAGIPAESFAAQSGSVTQDLHHRADEVNPLVLAAFETPPASFDDVIARYTELLRRVDDQWHAHVEAGGTDDEGFADPHLEQLRRVLYGPGAPCEVPDEPIVHTENNVDSDTCTKLWKLQGEVDRWIIQSNVEPRYALTLNDRDRPSRPRIFVRGNPAQKGAEVPRQLLSILAGPEREPFQHGSGRLELAQAIIAADNPLTARVIVNRVWGHHFGTGLVTTPSDFGTRATPPSHPDLLDWLATRFVRDGWSLKSLHRLIVNSAAFRQSSTGPNDPAMLAQAQRVDPDNRLLWRMNPRRLGFEELRDSMLAAAGVLDLSVGGKPDNLFGEPYPTRRTLYGLVDRQFLPSTLRVFDFANPDLHIPVRPETTVPQQALFLMNHPLIHEQARHLAEAAETAGERDAGIHLLFQRAYQREPTPTQLEQARAFLDQPAPVDTRPATAADWQYGFGIYNEEQQSVDGFTPLPHFTGEAWQGGAAWPDATLGWVQLTAEGGHPGNDRAHASVRRWTAPRDMTVAIDSELNHEATPGDGIRAFLVSSRSGLLASATAHQSVHPLSAGNVEVTEGETIDFVVDIGDVLNSDQYLWRASITPTDGELHWSSQADFGGAPNHLLTPWEQLAHVLLCANEFLFVD